MICRNIVVTNLSVSFADLDELYTIGAEPTDLVLVGCLKGWAHLFKPTVMRQACASEGAAVAV
jgi:hypothetical protein